jgi:hypothetical protein
VRRYIVSFATGAFRVCGGIEYVELLVEGQSFIIHQIRKMIGLAVLVLRYGLDALDKTRTAFSDKKVRCPAHELVAFSDNKARMIAHELMAVSAGLGAPAPLVPERRYVRPAGTAHARTSLEGLSIAVVATFPLVVAVAHPLNPQRACLPSPRRCTSRPRPPSASSSIASSSASSARCHAPL